MISVRIADVPVYLHEGGFYQALDLEKSEESVTVPADALKADDSVTNNAELLHLLASLQFWAVSRLPRSVIAYIIDDPAFQAVSELAAFATSSYPDLVDIAAIRMHSNDPDVRSMYAIENGLVDVLRYFHEKGTPFAFSSCNFACKANQLDVLQYLVSLNYHVDNLTGAFAAEAGSTKCLAYLLTLMQFNDRTINTAASCGQIECLKLLYAHGYKASAVTLTYAASSGQLEALKYLHEQKCEWDESACAKAAEGGHLECLKYLHENGCPWDKSTGLNAAADGHLDCLVYAHTHGAPMDDDLCGAAGCNGHLDCLKYLHEHNFPWDAALCRAAAQYGKLDVLQYAHEHGCPWDGDTTFSAAGMAKFDCLISAVQHGCPFDEARYEEWLAGAPPHVPVDKMRAELKANCVQS